METVLLFVLSWYLGLFCQTFFHHRYSAHQMFTMTRGWEKFFYVLSWLFMGSSYLSPKVYGLLHRMHHAYADTEKDPHSPKYDANPFAMMWRTKTVYSDLSRDKFPLEDRFKNNLPVWDSFDNFADG